MKSFYLQFCNKICVVEVKFNLRTFSQVLATVYRIINVQFWNVNELLTVKTCLNDI